MSGVLALALKRIALSHGTVPSTVPVGQAADGGTIGTIGTLGTVGTSGTVAATSPHQLASLAKNSKEEADAINERSAIAIECGKVPAPYADAFARLQTLRLGRVSIQEQELAVHDAGLFLDQWGEMALENGWSAGDLFDAPRNGGTGGLVWRMKRRVVTALGADGVYRIDGEPPARCSFQNRKE